MTLQDAVRDAIVVGVDGREHEDEAVTWAADQAALEGRRLVVAHADAQHALIDQRAESIRVAATRRHPGLQVVHVATSAGPRRFLREVSPGARLLVLGSRGRGVLGSVLLGSVGATVMRHAECPVVVTRHHDARWRSGVVVGLDGSPQSRPVVEFAFRLASLRGLPLTVLHSSFDPDAPDDTARVSLAEGEAADYGLLLAESLAGFTEKYPDVHVTRRIGRGLVDEQLLRGRHPWDVIVVGRHPRHSLLDAISGAVSTSVLERFRGVVAMVPEPADPGSGEPRSW